MSKIEIGKYYKDDFGLLVYCFGEESHLEAAHISYPAYEAVADDPGGDAFKNFMAIRVMPFISLEDALKFSKNVCVTTVFVDTDEQANKELEWVEMNPSEDIKERFQKTAFFLDIYRKFVNHMEDSYLHRYDKNQVRARDIFKKE